MAIATLSPYVPNPIPDPVSLTEASALFAETGHPVATRTLKRWARKHHVTVEERLGLGDVASWSDLLEVHAKEIDRREGAGR